jgi:hypothetical protein
MEALTAAASLTLAFSLCVAQKFLFLRFEFRIGN